MWQLGLLVSLFSTINGVLSQMLFGCPVGWEIHGTNCYKFVNEDKLFFEEARAACWFEGAKLIKIETYNEHQFVLDWINAHDTSTKYFTGGYYYHGILQWDFDDYADTSGVGYWVTGSPPPFTSQYTRVAYVLGGRNFAKVGWDVVPTSQPSGYICEIPKADVRDKITELRDIYYGSGGTDIQNIKVGPHIVKQPENLLVFSNTPTLHLECISNGNPIPKYSWRRDENTTVTSELDNRYTLSAGRFTVQLPVEQKDHGDYQCLATNEFGTVVSNPASVEFGYLQGFSPVKPEDVRANKFEGTRISCNSPSFFPDARYNWFFESIINPIFTDHNNMFVSRSGYLYFSSVQPTDARTYYCTVTLAASAGFDTSTSQPPSATSLGVKLIVLGTEHGYFKPFIYTHVFPSPAIRGATIRIECIAYGSLPLKYSWMRIGSRGFEPGTTISDNDRVITIENATLEAEGQYRCQVDGRGGVTSEIVSLTVESRPYFPFGIGDRLADPGQVLKWRCMAVGRPSPTYTWYKDGQPLRPIPGEIEIKRNYLLIKSVNEDRDKGMYQCGATNVHGTAFSYGQLKVLRFAPTFERHPIPTEISIPEGGNFTIPCQVEAAPLPDVVWQKNGGQLPVTPGDITGKLGMTYDYALVLNDITQGDAGYYTCKATNVLGEASNSTRVTVLPGIMITRAPSYQDISVNRTAFFYCQASFDRAASDVTYTWKLNGHDIDVIRNTMHYFQSKKGGLDGLYIRNAQFKHTGLYTCEARTTIHVVTASAYLTVKGPPGPPAGAYVASPSLTPTSCRLIWTIVPAMYHGNPVTRYDIEAEMYTLRPGVWEVIMTNVIEHHAAREAAEYGLKDDKRSIIVEGLLPDISYSFRVRAINDFGIGQEASKGSVSVKTPSTEPVTVPRNIRGLDEGKVGTLNIVWDPLEVWEYSGPNVGYNVYYKKKGEPKDWRHVNVSGADTTMFTALVGLDNYYLEYEVMVSAFNTHGSGPNSTVHTIMSAEGMPIATVLMGDCDNYNGTAFSMSWTPVEDSREVLKGRLKGYRIRFWHIDDPDFIMWYDLYGQHDSEIVIGLQDNTNYWSSVQVMNYAGVGPVGEIRLAETYHLPPREYPKHVTIYPHTEHSVRVTWQGVMTKYDEETIQGYILRVWKVQEDIRTARDMIVDVVDEAIIDGLQRKTVYVLRVLGHSIGGEGAKSPHVYFTIEGEAVPFDPSTTRFCFNQEMCSEASSIFVSSLTSIFALLVVLLLRFR